MQQTRLLTASPRERTMPMFSPCGAYRYWLDRETGIVGGRLVWLLLNPSTATAETDDPTVRKVVGFTRRAGYGSATIVNLFAFRATDPKKVRAHLSAGTDAALSFVEGPLNLSAIAEEASAAAAVVCGWGAHPWARAQAKRVIDMLERHPFQRTPRLMCIGTSKDGDPLHPLMPSYDGHHLRSFNLRRAA